MIQNARQRLIESSNQLKLDAANSEIDFLNTKISILKQRHNDEIKKLKAKIQSLQRSVYKLEHFKKLNIENKELRKIINRMRRHNLQRYKNGN